MRLELHRNCALWQAVTQDKLVLFSSIDQQRVTEFINNWSRQINNTLKTKARQ